LVSIEDIASSRIRLKLASLLSSRPATLSELGAATGISVQGVLKHLAKLEDAGIIHEESMKGGKFLRPRKLYFIESRKIGDYSDGDLLVSTLSRSSREPPQVSGDAYHELSSLAEDILILKSRARDLSHRMRRVMDGISEDQTRITALIDGLSLSPDERQIAYLIFTEDTPEQARAILKEHYGCSDPEGAIDSVVAELRRGRT
jgi:predicted transcriptional regulator